MNYKNTIVVLLLVLSGHFGYSQTVTEVLSNLVNVYSAAKPLQYKSTYTLYKDANSKKPEENYNGLFYKNNANELYVKIDKTEILNSKTINLKINHTEKSIVLSDATKNYTGDFDIRQLLDFCKITSFKDRKTYWEIVLTSKEFSGLAYSKIMVFVTKEYFVSKQVFYYTTGIDFSKDRHKTDIHYPRLEVTNSGFNRKPVSRELFDSKTYFTISNKKIVLSPAIKNYEFTDQRISK